MIFGTLDITPLLYLHQKISKILLTLDDDDLMTIPATYSTHIYLRVGDSPMDLAPPLLLPCPLDPQIAASVFPPGSPSTREWHTADTVSSQSL